MKITSIKAYKLATNKIAPSFKGESPGGWYYSHSCGESPRGGYYSCNCGESPRGVSRPRGCGESPRGGYYSHSCGESPSFGHRVNNSYAINNPEKSLQTKLDFLKMQQLARLKQISANKI